MRNLQKILALVLALVMSLSLMATAGADFSDQADIDPNYAESVEVLNGLNVFKGYPTGDFQPKGPITRAEVAAIIYRIATGDVDDAQKDIYSEYQKFSDVSGHWAAGYINYCANAEYIKGRGDGKFYPDDKVTGYEALAMILRVVGYDKNGEFTGSDWHIQTAAIANQQKVTAKVSSGLLAEAAPREMVAELLCQAILIPTVNYTLAYGYQQSDETIAKKNFQMERLTGVVTGNEIADLENSSPMAANQSRMQFADGRKETVNFSTGLEDLGLSVRAYIVPESGTTYKKLVTGKTYATELNHIYETSGKVTSDNLNETSPASTIKDEGINSLVGAEHYVNYDQTNEWTAKIRIFYAMDYTWTEREAKTMLRENGGDLWVYTDNTPANANNKNAAQGASNKVNITDEDPAAWSNQHITNLSYTYHYENTIVLNAKLSSYDYDNLLNIFTYADRTTPGGAHVHGEVHVGTTQVNEDISDQIRWEDFVKTYLVGSDIKQKVTSNGLGNWLRIIDNDNDGIADYVLQTIYTVGKISVNGKNLDNVGSDLVDADKVNNNTVSQDIISSKGHYLVPNPDETLNAGDVVVYAVIDGNIRAQKAEFVTSRISTVNRPAAKVTLADSTVLDESAVHAHASGLRSGVTNLDGNTNYTMYKDFFGNLAAFTEGTNGGLVLITNAWHGSTVSGSEYSVQAYVDGENGRSLQTINLASEGSLFVDNRTGSSNQWGKLRTDFGTAGSFVPGPVNNGGGDTIRTIVANLDGNVLTPVDKVYRYEKQLRMLDMVANAIPGRDNSVTSWANAYTTNYTAGNTPAYNNQIVEANEPSTTNPSKPAVNAYEVRALADTVYYVVSRGIGNDPTVGSNVRNNVIVQTYVGYNNMPKIDNTYIEDVYAVGTRHTASTVASGASPVYYTADVVVIELKQTPNNHKLHAEQVFIPDFYQVTGNPEGSWNGIEEVTMIRGNGELQENVKVDLRHSVSFNAYDIVSGTATFSGWQPGLYFMDPSDSNPDVYVIEKMSAADIRANAYVTGFVREDLSNNNYAQIEALARPETAVATVYVNSATLLSDNPATADAYYPTDAGDLQSWQSKEYVPGSSKTYTYGGTTGTLKEADAYTTVLRERRDDQLAGVTLNALNERWVEGTTQFTNKDRNEILVRYDALTNKIIWAVSFNEKNAAQVAWWNSLPDRQNTSDTVDFWDVDLSTITPDTLGMYHVPYVTADLAQKAGKPIFDLSSLGATIQNSTLSWWNPAKNAYEAPMTQAQINAIVPNPATAQRYRLEITLNTGEVRVFELVQDAAVTASQMNPNAAITAGSKIITLPTSGYPTIANFIDTFSASNNGSIDWTITVDGDTKTWNNRSGLEKPAAWTTRNTDDIQSMTAVVRAEDGNVVAGETYYAGPAGSGSVALANAKKAEATSKVPADVASDPTVSGKLSTILTKLENWKNNSTALEAYITGAYVTDLADLEAAVATAKQIKLQKSTFDADSGNTFGTIRTQAQVVISTSPAIVDADVTLNIAKGTAPVNGTYIFTIAGKDYSVTVDANTAWPVSIPVTGLTAGVSTIECAKVQSAVKNVTVSFTPASGSALPASGHVIYLAADANKNPIASVAQPLVPGSELKFRVDLPSTHEVLSVKAGAVDVPVADGVYTYTLPLTATADVTITVTVQETEAVEESKAEAVAAATILSKVNFSDAATSTAVANAQKALAAATTQAEIDDAMGELKTALGAQETDTLVTPVPAELPGTGTGGAIDNRVAAAALSGGVVVASPESFPSKANGVKLFGTPDKVYRKDETRTTDEIQALNALWWQDPAKESTDDIVAEIFRQIEAGAFNNNTPVSGVDSFAYVCIPMGANGDYTGDDAWVMIYRANGTYTAVNWTPDIANVSWN